ncbi:hypothetical protein [Nitrospira sp. BLG_2]|uniref:hypothetical protein n=1 Tax=Nitrospira sp. BLG_2 TaxID=3397507 RepID=UPI003B9AE162
MNRMAVILLILSTAAFLALLVFGFFWTTNGTKDLLDLGGNWDLHLSGKRVCFSITRAWTMTGDRADQDRVHSIQFLGFDASVHNSTIYAYPGAVRESGLAVTIPIWQIVMAHGLLIAGVCYLHSRRRRLLKGQALSCARCGYLLIGNASGVCPECGETIHEKLHRVSANT